MLRLGASNAFDTNNGVQGELIRPLASRALLVPQTPGGLFNRMGSDATTTAAGARSARDRLNKRPKVTLDETDATRLRLAAKARGVKPAHFMRQAILEAIKATEATQQPTNPNAKPPAITATAKDPAATVHKKLFLTPDENALLQKETKAAGLLQQDYMRLSVVAALTNAVPPKRKNAVSKNELAHEISMIAFQLKKIGTNLNQMAKQANTGLVPITRAEVMYFMNLHQRVLTLSVASLEKVLA